MTCCHCQPGPPPGKNIKLDRLGRCIYCGEIITSDSALGAPLQADKLDEAQYRDAIRKEIHEVGLEAYVVEMMWILAYTVDTLKGLTLALEGKLFSDGK